MSEKMCLLTVEDESIADDNALRQVIQTARYHGFEVSEYIERTCRLELVNGETNADRRDRFLICECSCCGFRMAWGAWVDMCVRFCPNCGAEVVER